MLTHNQTIEMRKLAATIRRNPVGNINNISYKRNNDGSYLILENGMYVGSHSAASLARLIMGIKEEDYQDSRL